MKRRTFLVTAAAAGLSAAFGAAHPARGEFAALRIVIAGGDLTEIVFALGAGGQVVGVDQTSTFPTEAGGLPQIGYVRRLSPEGILSLAPDLLIASHDAGPDIAVEQLVAAGIEVARAPAAPTADAIAGKIAFVGAALGREAEAAALATDFTRRLAAVRAKVSALKERPRVLFVLSVQNGAPMVGGQGTTAHQMIALAGGTNAADRIEGYKPMSRESVIAARPDVVLMMEQHATRAGGIDAVLSMPGIALTPAGRAGRAVTMDGMLLLGFGPRMPEAVAWLARALHPTTAPAAGL